MSNLLLLRRGLMATNKATSSNAVYANGQFNPNFEPVQLYAVQGYEYPTSITLSPTLSGVFYRNNSAVNVGLTLNGSTISVANYDAIRLRYRFEWLGTPQTGAVGAIMGGTDGISVNTRVFQLKFVDIVTGDYDITVPLDKSNTTSFNTINVLMYSRTYNAKISIEEITLL